MKILLADDDAVSRKLLQRTLERSGFEVTCVEDGQSAVDCLLTHDGPRIAILDWVMPGKNGPTVCSEIRASVDTPYVYLILLTSREATGDIVTGLEAGADDYLIKPCNPEELKARLRNGQRILELQDKLIHEARHDALTGLPNRAFFVKRLSESVRKAQERDGYQFALLFVDIDRFKTINDSLGHLAGDSLMMGVAQRLQQAVRSETISAEARRSRGAGTRVSDVVARIGGDEFVILLDDFADIEDGVRVAKRIKKLLDSAFVINGEDVFITASIGITTSSKDTVDPAEMLRGADTAMYKAKLHGKARYEVSDCKANTATMSQFKLEKDLRRAVEDNELEVHYQPIVDLSNGRATSFEALVRWRHPSLGLVQPDQFIPIAEETGLILAVGRWVMRQACGQVQEWNTRFAPQDPVSVCVNISPRQFMHQNLVEDVRLILHETGLEPRCLELEVTENLTMQDAVKATQILRELAALGVSISLDDFGTGYSSLSYLRRFPLRTLKIDRSFIKEIQDSRESVEIVQTIIALGHNLGMKVIAEGIESAAQLELLKTLRCDFGQGYLISRPIPAASARMFLKDGPMLHRYRPELALAIA